MQIREPICISGTSADRDESELLMLRGLSRPIGWIAIVAGVSTLLGQIPLLQPLFMVANAAYSA